MNWGKQRKLQNFFCSNKKGNQKKDKEGNETVETIFENKILLIVQDVWKVDYQILLLIV